MSTIQNSKSKASITDKYKFDSLNTNASVFYGPLPIVVGDTAQQSPASPLSPGALHVPPHGCRACAAAKQVRGGDSSEAAEKQPSSVSTPARCGRRNAIRALTHVCVAPCLPWRVGPQEAPHRTQTHCLSPAVGPHDR